jgi:hypothetical protein
LIWLHPAANSIESGDDSNNCLVDQLGLLSTLTDSRDDPDDCCIGQLGRLWNPTQTGEDSDICLIDQLEFVSLVLMAGREAGPNG